MNWLIVRKVPQRVQQLTESWQRRVSEEDARQRIGLLPVLAVGCNEDRERILVDAFRSMLNGRIRALQLNDCIDRGLIEATEVDWEGRWCYSGVKVPGSVPVVDRCDDAGCTKDGAATTTTSLWKYGSIDWCNIDGHFLLNDLAMGALRGRSCAPRWSRWGSPIRSEWCSRSNSSFSCSRRYRVDC